MSSSVSNANKIILSNHSRDFSFGFLLQELISFSLENSNSPNLFFRSLLVKIIHSNPNPFFLSKMDVLIGLYHSIQNLSIYKKRLDWDDTKFNIDFLSEDRETWKDHVIPLANWAQNKLLNFANRPKRKCLKSLLVDPTRTESKDFKYSWNICFNMLMKIKSKTI